MNFEFLSPLTMIQPFYVFCKDTEDFALSKPDISCACARKAIEYIVRLMYTAAIQTEANQLTVYDMLCSPDFIIYLDERTLLNAIHLIRRKGNQAVHQGGMTEADAREVVEQLHFVAGEVCIFLGLLMDYPPYDPSLLVKKELQSVRAADAFNEDEPSVENEIIRGFQERLKSVQHYSELREQSRRIGQQDFIDVHVNTSKYDEIEKEKGKKGRINTSTNSRAAFALFASWIREQLPQYRIVEDTRLLTLRIINGNREVTISVRTGCTGLGTRDSSGEWSMLPGIDYVLYCFEPDATKPILEQFHVFTKNEFLQMWRDLKLLVHKVSSKAHKQLHALYGDDYKIKTDEHADVIVVQVFVTSRKKTAAFYEAFAKFPAFGAEQLKRICARLG